MTTAGSGWRTRAALMISGALLLSTFGVVDAGAAGNGPPDHVLDRDRRGNDAIRALGDRLPAVAATNGRTPAEFRADLRADDQLWVGRTGRLLFIDEGLGQGAATEALTDPTEATHPLGATFELHSRAGAPRVIYLDFDGHNAATTAWDNGSNDIDAAPYDADGNPATFSDSERATIQDAWRRIAEDFAVFDIDVTTEDPGAAAIARSSSGDQNFGTRLVVTPTDVRGCGCGGVAYVGVFDSTGGSHDYYQPAWVFTSGVGNGAKNIAEAASHEVGHNLGLSHDGTATTGYYTGHGDWAPIMGVGYYRPITQWSRGEYAGASQSEDDFAVMAANGAPEVADDHGDTRATATTVTGPGVTLDGVISSADDRDAFQFTTGGGTIDLHARPASVSPDLDIELRLVDGNGATVAVVDPSSAASSGNDTSVGLDARVAITVAAGTYTLIIDGVGFGDPSLTGYSDYGSVGRYALHGTIGETGPPPPPPPPPPATPPAAPTNASATAAGSTVTVSWSDQSDDETGFEVVREFLHKNGSWRGQTSVASTGADTTSITDQPGSGTFRYRIRAVNAAGTSADAATNAVTPASDGGSGGGGKGKNR